MLCANGTVRDSSKNKCFADGMVVTHLPYGPSAYFGIHNTVLRHDIGQKKEVGGHIVFIDLVLRTFVSSM